MLENTEYKPKNAPRSLLINIQMIADELENTGIRFDLRTTNGTPRLREFNIFTDETQLNEDTLYFVPEELKDKFPTNKFNYISSVELDGDAPHISNVGLKDTVLIKKIIDIFQWYREFETGINSIIVNNGSLLDLCTLGMKFFRNPLYIHDRSFSIIALPKHVKGMLEFEKNEHENSYHIPLWLINEFKFDDAYQNTFKYKNAAIWGTDQYPHNIRSLYVNLLDGDYFYGRLLINEIESPLKPGQFRLAEIFADYLKLIIKRDAQSSSHYYKDYEDTIKSIVRGKPTEVKTELSDFLRIKDWNEDDEFVCIKFQTQDEKLSIHSEEALRSTIVREFKSCFDFYYHQKLCLIINSTKTGQSVSDIRSILAEMVRDSYMYVGISNYCKGITSIYTGFKQADIVLSYIKKHPNQWLMMFFECSLEYLLDSIKPEIDMNSVITPYIEVLRKHDEEYGTEYYKTLRSYIINERDIPKTSKDLVIHRTTLTHRLEQIQKIIRYDLDDENIRLYLLLSFKMFER